VVCLTEPDERRRAAYGDCAKHRCGPWLVPDGYGNAANKIGYSRYKIPTCPAKFIWRSSREFIGNQVFIAAIRYPKLRLVQGGIFSQPANVGQLIEIARGELRAFQQLKLASNNSD